MSRESLRAAVPEHTLASLDRYVDHRIPPGGFLQAVLENDLKGSLGRADLTNRAAIHDIVMYVYNEIPGNCQGSPEKVKRWLSPVSECSICRRRHGREIEHACE